MRNIQVTNGVKLVPIKIVIYLLENLFIIILITSYHSESYLTHEVPISTSLHEIRNFQPFAAISYYVKIVRKENNYKNPRWKMYNHFLFYKYEKQLHKGQIELT